MTSDPEEINTISEALADHQFEISWVKDGGELNKDLSDRYYDLAFLSVHLHNSTRDQSYQKLSQSNPSCPILVIGSLENVELARWAFRNGAYNVVETPLRKVDILTKAKQSIRLKETLRLNKATEQDLGHLYNQLKTFYYDIDNIVNYIKTQNIDESRIAEELSKKSRLGRCLFDFI